MRILHVMPHYYPALRYGGPIRSVQGLAAATAALGHDVHVYTTNIDGPNVSNVAIGVPTDLDGVNVWYFPAAVGRKVFRSPTMGRALETTILSFDIVHIHYMWVWTTVAAASTARRHGVPYVLAPRGMLVADLIRRRSSVAKKIWLALFDKRNVAGAAAIHATSDIEASDINKLGLETRRVTVIPNGVDLPADSTADDSASSDKRRLAATPPYILFLGRISWKKGLDRLVRALPNVFDAELIVAGYDENDYRTALERIARECGTHDRIRFVGPVEGDAKWALIRGSACLVLPSYNENFGMAVMEAMAARCPVVVTAEVGLANVVAEVGCGVIAPGDPLGLATAINSLLRNPGRAREMGANGLAVARDRFGWSTIARRTVELYGACAGQTNATGSHRPGRMTQSSQG